MKKIVSILALTFIIIAYGSQESKAQRYDESQYNYADPNSGVVYQLYLKFSGYQVQVWMKQYSQKQWTEYKVVESNDQTITVSYQSTKYHLEIDDNNPDVVVLYTSDFSSSFRYLKQ